MHTMWHSLGHLFAKGFLEFLDSQLQIAAQLGQWILYVPWVPVHTLGPEWWSLVTILGQPSFILFRPSSSPASHTPNSMAVTCSTHSYVANTFSRSTTTNTTPSSATNNLSSTTSKFSHRCSNPPTIHPIIRSWCPGNATRIAFHSSTWSTPSWLLRWLPILIHSAPWAPPSHFPTNTVRDNTSNKLHYPPPGSSTPCSCFIPSAHLWQKTTGCCADHRLSSHSTHHTYLLLSYTTTRSVCKKYVHIYMCV